MVVLQNADEGQIPMFGTVQAKKRMVQNHTAMFDLVWSFCEEGDLLTLELDYSTELFEQANILRQVMNFESLLAHLIENDDVRFAQVPIVSGYEKELITQFEQGPNCPMPSISVIENIAKQAQMTPKKIALRIDDKTFSYKELWGLVSHLAQGIHTQLAHAPHTKHRIGILMDRNEHMVFAILATLKTGNVYVPIDPDYPRDRIQLMLEDSDVSLVITDQDAFTFQDIPCMSVQQLLTAGEHVSPCDTVIHPDDLAYILYTSGSTGRPKGVMVTHNNLSNLCMDFVNRLAFKSSDRFLSITTISFDIFGLELFCPLLAGIELLVCHQDIARNPVYLVNYINGVQPSHMQATPTMWSMIADHLALKKGFTVLCGGEAMPTSLLTKLQQKASKIFNVYGPTETTIWSTAADLTMEKTIHIGRPISNTRCYVLSEGKNQVPIGAWGDLYIGGSGVAKGYWKQEELTQSVFITIGDELVYKTGDKAKWDISGNLIYGGRADTQIKLRGHRIELGDIETAILSCFDIKQAVVSIQFVQNEPILVAYIVPKEQPITVDDLRTHLENKLPAYMIPSALVEMETIPLTPNKKIDRKKLPVPNKEFASSNARYVQPANSFESEIQAIWQSVMKVNHLSVVESFFSLGGHSLHIPQIVSKINLEHNTSLTVREFILNSTIRDLAIFLTRK